MEQFQLQSELNITVIRFLLKRCIHRSFLLLFFVIFAIGKDTSASFVRAAGSQLFAITIYECLVFGITYSAVSAIIRAIMVIVIIEETIPC